MEWFKTRLGLKIWLAIWLLVALIPLWREDAREQLSGPWNSSDSFYVSQRGLTTEKVEAIAARAPADVAAQLELINAHRADSSSDASVIATNFDQYVRLSRRFPRENSVREAWLLDMTRGSLHIESDAAYYAAFPLQKGQYRPKRENWLGKPQLEAGVQAAREGARIEPRNSFFPWLEAALSFALHRPDDAMAALQRASQCAYFDDGITQTQRRRIALLRRVQSVGWSDKSRAMFGVLLPHLARIRATARTAMEVSAQAQGRGDQIGALQIAATVARAGATISDYQGLLITAAVGDAIQHLVWSEALKNAGREIKVPVFPDDGSYFGKKEFLPAREAYWKKVAQQVAIYARKLKQDAIAQQVLKALPDSKSGRLAAVYGAPDFPGAFQGFNRLGKVGWLERRLLWFSLGGAALWMVTFALSARRPLTPQSKRTAASLGAFCVGATAVLLGVGVFYFGLGSIETFLLNDSQKTSELGLEFEKKLNVIVALLWTLPLVLNAIMSTLDVPGGRERRGAGIIRGVQIAIYSAIVASLAAIWVISGVERFPPFSQVQNNATIALFSSLLAALFFHVAAAKKDTSRLAALLFWLVPLIVWATLIDFETFIRSVWAIPTFALICFLVGLCVQLTKWRPALPFRLETGDLSALHPLQTLLYAVIAGSLATVFVIYGLSENPIFNENGSISVAFSGLMILVVGGFHVVKARRKARIAALLFWSAPLILLAARAMLHPLYQADIMAGWSIVALLCLFWSARLSGWKVAFSTQRFGFDLIGRARILAATLAVASAVSYFGVKVAALPAEARMNALLDAQLKDGEVAWLEARLK